LRSEWTRRRSPCPSCTRRLSSPTTIGFDRTLPAVRSNARLGMGAPSPPSGPPTHGRCTRNGTPRRGRCPARGPRVNPRDALTLSTRTGCLPNHLAPSRMPQLHDAWEQEAGGESTKSAPATRGTAPSHGHPGAETETASLSTTHHDSDSTPKAYRLGLETATRPVGCFRSTPTARPTAWNNDSEGCRTQEPRLLLLGDTPARGA
jgi:hypothetical protein